MNNFVYADNCATTRLDNDALEAMIPFLTDEYANASQKYSFAKKSREALKNARKTIAECIGADENEIYFTGGGTEGDNLAIKNILFMKGKGILTSQIEHHAVLNPCKQMELFGTRVSYLPVNSCAEITVESLEKVITDNIGIVSIMTANNEFGTVQDIDTLCKISHKHGCIFHTDAVQAVGHIDIDVKKSGVDMLSSSAHKFGGPKGVGFVYIKSGTDIKPLLSGGAQERNIRAGTENVAGIVGMSVALKKMTDDMSKNQRHLIRLEKIITDSLDGYDFVRTVGTKNLPGVISLSFNGFDGEAILHRLDLMGVCVSTGSACDSVNTQISHCLKAVGLDEKYAKGTIRISFSKDNTEQDAIIVAEKLKKILNG